MVAVIVYHCFFIEKRYFFSVFLLSVRFFCFPLRIGNPKLCIMFKNVECMKRAFMSITLLVLSLSMLVTVVAGFVASVVE